MFKRFTNACVRVVNRWLPDAFLFAVILTFVVYVAAMFATGMGPIKVLAAWGNSDGFWGLLAFSMQMALVLVLAFVLVGVAGLGLAGAASATVISQMVGGVAPIFYFAKRRPGCRLYFTKPLFSLRELFKACTNGISELMTNISMSLVGALYNMQLLKLFGADGVAAYGVLMYVGFVFAAVFIGYSQGTAPIVSYHFGADNKDELKNLLRKSAGIIAVAGVAMLTSSELLAEPLAKIFVGYDAGLLALTTHGMKLYCISFILSGFNIFGSAFFTALNNGTVSAAISFLRTLLFQVVSILTLPLIIGVDGIWLAVVAAEAMALVCTGGFVVRGRKRYGYL
mgnify:CR=1 FL=1